MMNRNAKSLGSRVVTAAGVGLGVSIVIAVSVIGEKPFSCELVPSPEVTITRSGPQHSYNFCEDLELVYPLVIDGTNLSASVPEFISTTPGGGLMSVHIDNSYSRSSTNLGSAILCLTEPSMKSSKVVIEYKSATDSDDDASGQCSRKVVEIDNLHEMFLELGPRKQIPEPRDCAGFEVLPPIRLQRVGFENNQCTKIRLSYPEKIQGTDLEVMPPHLIRQSDDGYAVAIPVEAIYSRESKKNNEASAVFCLSNIALEEVKISIMYWDWTPPEDARRGCEKIIELESLDKILVTGK